MRQAKHRRAISTTMALFCLVFAACGGGDDDVAVQARNAQLAEGCLLNTDCTAPFVCAFRKCHVQCTSTRDCDPGLLCVASDKPFYVCQLQSETRCAYNSQCSGSQVCGVDGKCREQCATEKDCLPGQKCAQATCAEPPELSGGKLPVASGASGAGGAPSGGACLYADDCRENEVCRGGQCMAECRVDRDCASPKVCVDGRCKLPPPADGSTPPNGYGDGCNLNSDCPAPLLCGKSGLCVYECNAHVDCASKCCEGHACVDASVCGGSGGAAGAAGAAGATIGGAAGAGGSSGAGGSVVGGPCDVDQDGFKAVGGACGGDDCDDTKGAVHPFAKELCDGVDNNCDGFVDENAWVASGVKELAIPGDYPGAGAFGSAPPGLVAWSTTPPRVFLTAGDMAPGGSQRVVLQELDDKLDPVGADATLEAMTWVYKTSLATDGSTLMVAASVEGSGASLRAASFAVGAPPSTLPIVASGTSYQSRPVLAWTGSRYALVWADAHDGPARLYRSTASPNQPFSTPVPVYADPTRITQGSGVWPSVALGTSGAKVSIVSRTNMTGGVATFDAALSTVSVPTNDDIGLDVWPSAVANVGGDWLGIGYAGGYTTAVRLSGATGALVTSRRFSLDGGFGDVLPLGNGGALVAWAAGTSIKYAFVTPDLATNGSTDPGKFSPLPFNEVQAGPQPISAPVLARIDATHIALVWQDGRLKASVLACVP